jgi:1,4-dihydroxy-2-naphthoate octaprenyltransferase
MAPPTDDGITRDRERAIRVIKVFLFSASIVAAVVGGATAAREPAARGLDFLLAAFGLFIGQAGGDYLYYYFTRFHTDPRDAHTKIFAGWRPLFVDRLIAPERSLRAGVVCLAIGAAVGLHFTLKLGYAVVPLALAGGAVAVFFTPLMLKGLKELVIFVTFGPLSVAGVHYVLAGRFAVAPVAASLPVGFFVTVVAYLKGAHFRVGSGRQGERVLDVRASHIAVLYALGYGCLAAAVIGGLLAPWTLLALLSAPFAADVVRRVAAGSSAVADYLWAVVESLVVLIAGGGLVAVGCLL